MKLSARTVKHKAIIVTSFLKTVGVRDLLGKGDWPTYTEEDPEIYAPEELQKFFIACTPEEFLLVPNSSCTRGSAMARFAHLQNGRTPTSPHGTVKVKPKEAGKSQS